MKKSYFIVLVVFIAFIILVFLGAGLFLQIRSGEVTEVENPYIENPTLFPDSFPQGSDGPTGFDSDREIVKPEDGELLVETGSGSLVVKDFKEDSPSLQGLKEKSYTLVGERAYYEDEFLPPNTKVPAHLADTYEITYYESDSGFLVVLLKSPLGPARREAEEKLLSLLDISEAQACDLKYEVSVPSDINEEFAGRNLKFSFCPGHILLSDI